MSTSHGLLIYNNDITPDSLVDLKQDVKITEYESQKNTNTSLFVLEKEDHTLANLLRMKLHENSQVKQAGYRVPHPTQHRCEIRVQTAKDGTDREVPTPKQAMVMALTECRNDLEECKRLLLASLQAKNVTYSNSDILP